MHAAMGSSCAHLCLYAGSHANTVCHLRIPMFSLCENLAPRFLAFAFGPLATTGAGGEGERGGGKERGEAGPACVCE